MKNIYDLIIIGAGPSALTAAIYAARENIKTLLIEKATVGGMAAMTDMIDNYPGFPEGITGFELSSLMQKQAERFGAEFIYGEVVSINNDKSYKTIKLSDDQQLKSKSLLIASGSKPCKLGVPGEDEYYGRGVHYCATCDGAFYNGKKVIVVGGGNSAVQEAIFLTRFASSIEIVSLYDITACQLLKKSLKKFIDQGKIKLHTNAKTKKILVENNKVSGLEIEKDGKISIITADGVFIFIGLSPNTSFLNNSDIKLDKRGFILTDQYLETSSPGIFASGDARSSATAQVVSAAGEGATVALSIREYLESLNQ